MIRHFSAKEPLTDMFNLYKKWASVWSPDKKPRLSSMSIVKHKDHTMTFTLMAPKWMRKWGAAAVVNRRFQVQTARQQHGTIFAEATAIPLALDYCRRMGPVHHDVVVYSVCRQLGAKTPTALLFVTSWTCTDNWVARAHVFASAGYQATVALRVIKEWTN